ncbi:MAG: class II aldolase/adducin family protein [Candidatus Altiarchaeota archaeon]|nr:class II aldolase/adducin family protein [Candidatus Altiarchaeota archaeon]
MGERYAGVKFKTMFVGSRGNKGESGKRIIQISKVLAEKGLVEQKVGNVSERVESGMLITPTGQDLGSLTEEDLVKVVDYLEEANIMKVFGRKQPSSESIMHWMIYKGFQKVNAVVHVHPKDLGGKKIPETEREQPYGTPELAKEAVKAFKENKRSKIIVLKNHGIVCIGKDLEECKKMLFKKLGL